MIEYVTSPQQIVCDTRPMPVGAYSIRVVVDGMRQADYWSNFQVTACACLCALYPCPAFRPSLCCVMQISVREASQMQAAD